MLATRPYELDPEPELEPGVGEGGLGHYQQQQYQQQQPQQFAPQVAMVSLRPPPVTPRREDSTSMPQSARAVSHAAEVRIETELDHVRGQIAQLEEEGRTALEHVSRLDSEVSQAQAELARARELKQSLAQQVEEAEQVSVNAYHTNAAVIEQNTAMQRELQQLQAQISAAQTEAAAENKLRFEKELELKQEQDACAEVLDTLSEVHPYPPRGHLPSGKSRGLCTYQNVSYAWSFSSNVRAKSSTS